MVILLVGSLHYVAVGCIADILEECAASIFMIEVSRGSNCLGYICLYPDKGRRCCSEILVNLCTAT
jgi:hypothetical protein